jgi:hypothetical protein
MNKKVPTPGPFQPTALFTARWAGLLPSQVVPVRASLSPSLPTLPAFRVLLPLAQAQQIASTRSARRIEEGGRMASDGHPPELGKEEAATTASGPGARDLDDPQFMCCVCL